MLFLGHPVSLSRKTLRKASNRHRCRYFRQPLCQKAQAGNMSCWTTKLQADSVFCSHRETCKANVEKFGFLKKSAHLPLKGMHEWMHFQIYFPAWQQRFSFRIHHPTSVPRTEASDKQLNFPLSFILQGPITKIGQSETNALISELQMLTVQPWFVLRYAECPDTTHKLSVFEPEFRVWSTPLLLHLAPNPALSCPPHPHILHCGKSKLTTTLKTIHLQASSSKLQLQQESDLRLNKNFCFHWEVSYFPTQLALSRTLVCFPGQMSNFFCQPTVSFPPVQ